MRMHPGLLAATAAQQLLAELARHAGDLTVGKAVGSPHDIELKADNAGWLMAIGEREGMRSSSTAR